MNLDLIFKSKIPQIKMFIVPISNLNKLIASLNSNIKSRNKHKLKKKIKAEKKAKKILKSRKVIPLSLNSTTYLHPTLKIKYS